METCCISTQSFQNSSSAIQQEGLKHTPTFYIVKSNAVFSNEASSRITSHLVKFLARLGRVVQTLISPSLSCESPELVLVAQLWAPGKKGSGLVIQQKLSRLQNKSGHLVNTKASIEFQFPKQGSSVLIEGDM